ncbi:transposase [Paenibacillus larvae]|nr:transposase [Paenibacillus larvae]MDT2304092.1 transposase [Paenibacillus larvae]
MGNSQDAGVAKLLESVLNQVLQAQVSEQVEAVIVMNEQRIEKRTGMDRIHMGCIRGVGTITPSVPRIRGGKFTTELFSRYQRSEQALTKRWSEMVVNVALPRVKFKVTEELRNRVF